MSDKSKIDLSTLSPDQVKQLEQVLTNLISSAKPRQSAERPIAGDIDHSSHASG